MVPDLFSHGLADAIFILIAAWSCYSGLIVLYRLYLHPLRRFPGPKVAAATLWYETYFDVFRGGQYTFEIERMHEQYGPIVRISPHELHCNDPAFIDILYTTGSQKRDKYGWMTNQFGNGESVLGAVTHDLHRLRRNALAKFFSKASINNIDDLIREKIEVLCTKIESVGDRAEPINMTLAFSCFTGDVVTEYAFARCYDFLESPSFERNFHKSIDTGLRLGPSTKHFPTLMGLMYLLPDNVLLMLNPDMAVYLGFQRDLSAQVSEIKKAAASQDKEIQEKLREKTIFQHLVSSDEIPNGEKSVSRLMQEGILVVSAGTETTAWALSVALFYILRDEDILKRLAVVTETLRLSSPVMTRLQRVAHTPLLYRPSEPKIDPAAKNNKPAANKGYTIPPGTPVGMTAHLIHQHRSIFPDPDKFVPDRWLQPGAARLEKFLLPFSRGSRQCLGINLAYAELYAGLAAVIRRFGPRMRLYETSFEEDIKCIADFFVPVQKSGRGVRVTIDKA